MAEIIHAWKRIKEDRYSMEGAKVHDSLQHGPRMIVFA